MSVLSDSNQSDIYSLDFSEVVQLVVLQTEIWEKNAIRSQESFSHQFVQKDASDEFVVALCVLKIDHSLVQEAEVYLFPEVFFQIPEIILQRSVKYLQGVSPGEPDDNPLLIPERLKARGKRLHEALL